MACCGKRNVVAKGDGIPHEMKEIKVEKFDELFKDGGEALKSAEDLRAGLQDAKAACMSLSGAYTLKTGSMGDALKTWFWSVGAEVGLDSLDKIKPDIKMDSEPHFDIKFENPLSTENQEFYEAFKCYVDFVIAAPESIKTLGEKLKACSEKASELAGTASDECKDAGLNVMDSAKAVAAIGTNTKTLTNGVAKLTALGPVATDAATQLKEIAEQVASIVTEAAKNIEEGKGKGAKTAAEFCEKQHPGEKNDAKTNEKAADKVRYDANTKAGKKIPSAPTKASGGADAAPAPEGDAAPEGEATVSPADVQPKIKDV